MSLYTPFNKWVTEEHKLFTDSVQKFYNDEMKPNIEDWVNNGVVSKSFWEKAGLCWNYVRICFRRIWWSWRRYGL